MTPEHLIRRCHEFAAIGDDAGKDADSLIGLFQAFRPDGRGIVGLFDQLDHNESLHERLQQLYAIAGEDRRPQGGRDAYFIVRRPQPIDPGHAQQLASSWLDGVREIAIALDNQQVAEMLAPMPNIRVLEGLPPKHPKAAEERSHLLTTIQIKAAEMIERMDVGEIAPTLRTAYYFTACDSMLRDYLMWPFYAGATGLEDPLRSYFELWKHGVKYRIFGESQVDLYLPRQSD
jgi:hypothetical protein